MKTNNGRMILLSKNVQCVIVKNWTKTEEARGLISNLTLIKILFLSDLPLIKAFLKKYFMNSIVNKLLLAGGEFIQEMHLK